MARLASPGYNRTVLVTQVLQPADERIIEFKGLNRMDVTEEGEMSAMKNLTSSNYPLLTPRKLRGTYTLPEGVKIPLAITARYERIAMVAKDNEDNVNFYYDGEKINEVVGLSEATEMVAINTKLCFFPQKKYVEIRTSGSSVVVDNFGSLEETFTTATGLTVTISSEDVRITLPSEHGFKYDDAVNINGTLSYTSGGTSKTAACNVSCAIEAVDGNTLVLPRDTFIELTGEGATSITFIGTIGRTMPDLDHVIEWNNRLWGCSSADNTIYACKLGDPTNWQYYQGTGLDSYYAQQGTDGIWTGSAAYSSHIIFFKQNSMTKVYGSMPASFQVVNVQCYGVEEGSRKSVVVVNDKVFYKSVIGIMAYDGGLPYCISDKFNSKAKAVVGGTEGQKYYASMKTADVGPELMVLDIERGLWHKEDSTRFRDCCTINNKLYFITQDSESITCSDEIFCDSYLLCGEGEASAGVVRVINPINPTETYADMPWMAVFGPFDEWIENRKIYSKLLLRLLRKNDSAVRVYISINGGAWELVQSFNPATTGGDYIPIIPRRCDRYSVKIEGTGDCCIKSLTRRVRRGTGGRL